MKKLFLLSSLLMFCLSASYAQVESDFERFKREQEAMMNSMKQNDSLLLNKLEKEYPIMNRPTWMSDPTISHIPQEKLDFLSEMFEKVKGKNKNELMHISFLKRKHLKKLRIY